MNLRLRAEVMQRIARRIERKGQTQREAAEQGGITQPRVNDLLRRRLSRFSPDALVNIAAAMGPRVELKAALRHSGGARRGEAEVGNCALNHPV